MYIVRIKTKFNVINLKVEDINTPEFEEIINQPYVIEVYIEKEKTLERKKND